MAKLVDVGSLASYFESLDDPRHTRNRKHLLVDIVVITVCAIICGCDGPTAIHRWAKHHQSWLAQHLALPNGIPSRDCIRRLLVTTNLPFSEWNQIFQGERMTAALLDRLTHHCHIFEMNGESYRFRESMKAKKARKAE